MHTVNKKASFNYQLEPERIEAGISLTGAEAKAVRENRVNLSEAVARIINQEAFLINANISAVGTTGYIPSRSRKLLLHKSEITSIASKLKQQKLTLVPTKLYTKGHLVKCQLALGKLKRKFEKREVIKKKVITRELEQELKQSKN